VTRHYCPSMIGKRVCAKPAVILPASRLVLVSSREVFQPSNRFSSDPCESRTKATSDASLEGRSRASLGGRSRRLRRTRRAVVRVLPYITSEYGLQRSAMWKRKRNFGSMDMDTSTHYLTLQKEFRRLHTAGQTFRRMAAVLGISERTVTAWRKELDLPRRPRGRRPRKV